MSKTGWLVNDQLTCIPGTKTLWHDLLDWIPGLQDKTNGHTPFSNLGPLIRDQWLNTSTELRPNYIIRNGTFFGPLNLYGPPIISLIQDVMPPGFLRNMQFSVACESHAIVFNSEFTKQQYPELHNKMHRVIPLGVDFRFFDRHHSIESVPEILSDSVLFVGAKNEYPKGFDRVLRLIDETNYNFCLVMKDDYHIDHPRVRVFNRVEQKQMASIYKSCKTLICTSRMETQHLAGIEAAACGLPIVATNVGIYSTPGHWGLQIKQDDKTEHQVVNHFKTALSIIFREGIVTSFSPRSTMLTMGYDKETCAAKWQKLVYECTHPHH